MKYKSWSCVKILPEGNVAQTSQMASFIFHISTNELLYKIQLNYLITSKDRACTGEKFINP